MQKSDGMRSLLSGDFGVENPHPFQNLAVNKGGVFDMFGESNYHTLTIYVITAVIGPPQAPKKIAISRF